MTRTWIAAAVVSASLILGCADPIVRPPGGPRVGGPCDDRCEACIAVTGGSSVCTASCATAATCPMGSACTEWPTLPGRVCVPPPASADAAMQSIDAAVPPGVDAGPLDAAAIDVGPAACGPDTLRCNGACAACPTGDAIETLACADDVCVAATCASGYTRCTTGCCRFELTTVDAASDVGRFASMARAGDGTLHVAYYDLDAGALRYARIDTSDRIDREVLDATDQSGAFASLAVDARSVPHVSYYSVVAAELRYARREIDGVVREVADADGDVGWHTSIAINSRGEPRIAYMAYDPRGLRYAQPGAAWTVTRLRTPTGEVGAHAALVLDSAGRPIIAYRDDTARVLRATRFDGTRWTDEVIDRAGDPGAFASMVLGPDGRARVAYYAAEPGDLRVASDDAGVWTVSTVASDGDVGQHASLGFARDGSMLIAFRDETRRALALLRETADPSIEIVDDAGDPGSFASLVVAPDDTLAIAYYAAEPGDLRLARWR
jgi:hypothetical protein